MILYNYTIWKHFLGNKRQETDCWVGWAWLDPWTWSFEDQFPTHIVIHFDFPQVNPRFVKKKKQNHITVF